MAQTGWDPAQYRRFAGDRLRPALDLLGRIHVDHPSEIVDLGAGAGNVTRVLRERWPGARITGVDASPEMLAEARATNPDMTWVEADLASWRPAGSLDVLFSNAALHWLPSHDTLFPRLLADVKPAGVLAVQMPCNFASPSHTSIVEAVRSGPWRSKLEPLLRPVPVHAPAFYFDLLAPHTADVEIWETEYVHVLKGEHPVKEWVKGTWLKPLLDALDPADRLAFETCYADLTDAAYPRRLDGRTLFPFRRLFIVARR